MRRWVLAAGFLVIGLLLPQSAPALSGYGTDFWFAPSLFDQINPDRGNWPFELDIVSDSFANVSIDGAVWWIGTVEPGAPQSIRFDLSPRRSEDRTVTQYGVHITSDAPINVTYRYSGGAYDDTGLVLPTDSLDTEYYMLTHPWEAQNSGAGFMIVSLRDGTQVDWQDPCEFGNPTVSVTLNRGETYMALCQGDVNGAHITASAEIAVFAVTHGQYIPYDRLGCCADPVLEQLAPVISWGTRHYVPRTPRGPEATDLKEYLLVVASQDATNVTLDGADQTIDDTLDAGGSGSYQIEGPVQVLSDKPVSVMLVYKSHYVTDKGDPYEVVITPERSRFQSYRFLIPAFFDPDWENYITVISESGPDARVSLDGIPVSGTWIPVPNSTHQQLDILVSEGEHLVQAAVPVTAYVHTYRIHESTGHPAGASSLLPNCSATAVAPDLELCPTDVPLLDGSDSVVNLCNGVPEYRWLEDGVPLGPFTRDPRHLANPPVGQTPYTLEVRCSSDPACIGQTDFLVTRYPPGPLDDVGNTLRVSREPGASPLDLLLEWPEFVPPGREGEHYHVYRASSPIGPFLRRDADPTTRARRFREFATGSLLYYDVRVADLCETLSADAYPHTLPTDCFETVLACGYSASSTVEPSCPATIDTHDCAAGSSPGPERSHLLEIASPATLRIDMQQAPPELRLFLYDESGAVCLGGGEQSLQMPVAAGAYRVIVDSPDSASLRDYTLDVRCQ